MHGKKSFLALSTAFAALFVGCEWTGSSESDSWSSAYDAMNFSGTYRAVTRQTSTGTTEEQEVTDTSFASVSSEKGGNFDAGANILSGSTYFSNIVPGSFQASSSGGYVWNDDGAGNLLFTDPNSGSSGGSSSESKFNNVKNESVGTVSSKNQKFSLKGNTITPGSVKVQVGTYVLSDNGENALSMDNASTAAKGSVDYSAGTITLNFSGAYPNGSEVFVSYQWEEKSNQTTQTEDLSGTGKILYQSGAWSLQIKPAMASSQAITVRYSYYIKDSTKTSTYTTITSGEDVSALTVSQNGQNLTITLNNGIVMSGKFTNVQQTGKVNQDTNAGYNTYNAQFQVQSTDTKLVGTLNYDLQYGYRMLNGTWTWGRNSYDVQAVGPAWLNSADASTLSPGVLTK